MANTLLQSVVRNTFGSGTSGTATFGSACTPGSLIVVEVSIELYSASITVSDGVNSGNYAADAVYDAGGAGTGSGKAGIYSMQNTSGSALTITVTTGAATYGAITIYEIGGAASSSALDSQSGGGNINPPGNGTNTATITRTTANCSVFAVGPHYGAGAAADSGFTAPFSEVGINAAYHFGEYQLDAGATGNTTVTFGFAAGSRDGWSLALAAYKTAGSGGGGGGVALMGQICT